MELDNPLLQSQLDVWLVRQNEALNSAERELQKARFAERQIDRVLHEAGVEIPEQRKPALFIIQGGKDEA